jgi:glycosyltransferase involved in cell wall biosynthesis
MRLLLLNQFGLASGAPTGRILAELGSALEQRGHQVRVLTTDSSYGKPRQGPGRLVQELLSHSLLAWQSLRGPKPDAVISLTSPACLAVTATVVARLRRARHFHWSMDLYPDVGVRLGELKDGPLVRLLSFLMRRAYQGAERVITLDEDMREYVQNHYGVDSAVIGPFPPEVAWPSVRKEPKALRQWLYSGNFGRAHEIEVLLQIQKRLEDRRVPAELILQGQGPQFTSCRENARRLGLRQVQWRAPVPQEKLAESLVQSDVLVVTRKADLTGLLLPSKLILAELSGRAILWIGDTGGKTAQRLAREGRHGVFAVEDVEPIAAWLQRLFERETSSQAIEPTPTRFVRERAIDDLEALLLKSFPVDVPR